MLESPSPNVGDSIKLVNFGVTLEGGVLSVAYWDVRTGEWAIEFTDTRFGYIYAKSTDGGARLISLTLQSTGEIFEF